MRPRVLIGAIAAVFALLAIAGTLTWLVAPHVATPDGALVAACFALALGWLAWRHTDAVAACSRCGGALDAALGFCGACGADGPAKPPSSARPRRA